MLAGGRLRPIMVVASCKRRDCPPRASCTDCMIVGELSQREVVMIGLVEQIGQAICRPEGTAEFEYQSDGAFKESGEAGVLIEVPAGGHYFRLERTAQRALRFYHSSPGTGTRVAEISLAGLPDFERAYLALTWTPAATCFYLGPRIPDGSLLSAAGEPSDIEFRVGRDNSVFQIGGAGVEVVVTRVRRAGQPVLVPTAIETWRSTIKAVEMLSTGESDYGFMFEVVQANATLSILVTGLESYSKTRFLELETEGIAADWTQTYSAFASRAERESDWLTEQARADGVSMLEALVSRGRINFQSFDHLKRAYKAAYGIKVGELALRAQTLSQLRQFIRHRHRVVHVSWLLTMLNEESVPPEEPVFAKRETAKRASECFDEFVQVLHEATLTLRPVLPDGDSQESA